MATKEMARRSAGPSDPMENMALAGVWAAVSTMSRRSPKPPASAASLRKPMEAKVSRLPSWAAWAQRLRIRSDQRC